MEKQIQEKDLKRIFKEFMKLNNLSRKCQLQDQRINYVMEEVFKDTLCEKIISNSDFVDDILAYYSNAEGWNYKEFKKRFSEVIKQEDSAE